VTTPENDVKSLPPGCPDPSGYLKALFDHYSNLTGKLIFLHEGWLFEVALDARPGWRLVSADPPPPPTDVFRLTITTRNLPLVERAYHEVRGTYPPTPALMQIADALAQWAKADGSRWVVVMDRLYPGTTDPDGPIGAFLATLARSGVTFELGRG